MTAPTPTMPTTPTTGPLHGFTVVEACQMVAGPMAGALLAEMGAEVVKVENPTGGGDRMRFLGHRKGSMGALWAGVNRGKRSVVLDLQRSEGVDVLRRLVRGADVFIQNFRPGVAERLGIGYDDLHEVNDRLVYVSVSGFGPTGPYVDQKSYDYVVQALSGMAALQTDPQTGDPALIRNIVVDKLTAHAATEATLAALLARDRGAGGQHVQVAMLDVAVAFLWPDGMMQHTLLGDDVTEAPHNADSYVVRRCADGSLAMTGFSDRQFPGVCRALGRPEWIDDPRFATMTSREQHMDEINALIGAEMERRAARDVLAALVEQDVPAAVITPVGRVHEDPQVMHNELIVEHERPWLGLVREPRPAVRFGRTPTRLGRHAPRHDEHTDEVLGELGYGPDAIAALRAAGTIGPRS